MDFVLRNFLLSYHIDLPLRISYILACTDFTVNNKDTRTTPLTSLILCVVNIDILNTHYFCA